MNEWDAKAPRPGLLSLTLRRWNTASLRAGGVVSRDGVNLGVDPTTGRLVGVSWQWARGGVLVTGARREEVTATGFRVVRAAVRRRLAVIVADLQVPRGCGRRWPPSAQTWACRSWK